MYFGSFIYSIPVIIPVIECQITTHSSTKTGVLAYIASPATGTMNALKPVYSLDCRGFLVLKHLIPVIN
jgi:hypothetical protein